MDSHYYCTLQVSRAHEYRSLPQIGHDRARDLPHRAWILVDGGYAARVPVITPRQIARNRRQLQANRALHSLRMQIERSIGFQKVYNLLIQYLGTSVVFCPFLFVHLFSAGMKLIQFVSR